MDEKTTGDLMDILEKKPLSISLKQISSEQIHTSLSERIKAKINKYGLKTAEVFNRSGIKKQYFYEILNGERQNPSRDFLIQLCIGMGLSLSETQEFLKYSGAAPLYARNRRDSVLIYCFQRGLSIVDTDIKLDECGEEPLVKS